LPCLAIFRSAVPCSLSLPSSPTRRSSDLDGGALRYRGVDIEELVEKGVTFGDVWALLVDGEFGRGLHPAEPFPLPIHTGDVRVDVQAGLAMLAPIWGFRPLLDIDDATARDNLARAAVMALSYVAQSRSEERRVGKEWRARWAPCHT